MNKKQYTIFRIIIAMILAGVVSFSVVNDNFIIPIFAVATSVVFLLILRKNVKEVLVDERDYQVSGKAARWAISAYAMSAFLLAMLSFAMKDMQAEFEVIGSTLAYSACAIMLLYALIFTAIEKGNKHTKYKFWIILAIIIISFIFVVAGLRIISGEDNWICQDGEWIPHGSPTDLPPDKPCEN